MTSDSLVATIQDGRQTQGKTPVYRPMVDGEELDITVSSLSLSIVEGQHDAATLAATSSTLIETTGLKGKPIAFYYGLPPRTELFYGYIDSVRDDPNQTGAGHLSFTMTCLGATKEMQTGRPRFFTNSTIPKVIENLAYQGLLGFHGHGHPLSWPVLAQTEESDWKFASLLAARLGWSLYNRYGVVMLYDPLTLLQENGSFIQLVASQYSSTAFVDYERALIEFTPVEESDSAYRQIGAKISYFNKDTVQTVSQRGDSYTVFKYLTNVVARGPQEAELYANMTANAAAFWSQQATARVLGNANIFPGMSVDIFTTNPKYYTGRFNGRWLVRGVQHKADRQTFQTELVLARPGDAGASQGPYVPFWNQISGFNTPGTINLFADSVLPPSTELVVPPLKPRPSMTLFEGRWQSSWANPNVRAAA